MSFVDCFEQLFSVGLIVWLVGFVVMMIGWMFGLMVRRVLRLFNLVSDVMD